MLNVNGLPVVYVGMKLRFAVPPTAMPVTLLATTPLLEYTRLAVKGPVPPESVVEIITFWPMSRVFVAGVRAVPAGAVLTVAAEDGPEVVVTGVDALSVAVTL